MTMRPVPESLRIARRSLDGVAGIDVCGDWSRHEKLERWALLLRLKPGTVPHSFIPEQTSWYVLVEERYPLGKVTFYPAAVDGLTTTFPHQHYNGTDADRLWRSGDICLEDYLTVMGRGSANPEPESVETRLLWRAERALEWLRAASQDQLLPEGTPFELPEFPETSTLPKVVFSEDPVSFDVWKRHNHRYGIVEVLRPVDVPAAVVVQRFLAPSGRVIWEPSWGSALATREERPEHGIWVRLDSVPVEPPWQAPETWGQLRSLALQGGVDLDQTLRSALSRIRDGRPHLLLFGFPIPRTMGEPVVQLHWQAVQLPALCDRVQVPHGFRRNEAGQWQGDRVRVFARDRPIDWCVSENWHTAEISTRGRAPQAVSQLAVLLIGAGTLGSAVAELLVRSGISKLTILDGEVLEAGNLVRHTLLLGDVGRSKAQAVAARLNLATPAARVQSIAETFPPTDIDIESTRAADVVIDTTGSNDVVASMAAYPWQSPRRFFSLSLSRGAEQLYLFSACGSAFPCASFRKAVDPLVAEDAERYEEDPPWEGTGCWHPVFPARSDDIWLLAAAGVKRMIKMMEEPPFGPQMLVLKDVVQEKSYSVADAA